MQRCVGSRWASYLVGRSVLLSSSMMVSRRLFGTLHERPDAPVADATSCSQTTPTQATSPLSNQLPRKVFSSTIRFKVSDSNVTDENLPTLEDLNKMVPSLKELHQQLPSAKDMEAKYIFSSVAAQQAAAERSVNTGENQPLWPNCDTPEEIMDEERYGADGEVRPAPSQDQVKLAWRALGWGTLFATVGVMVLSVVGLYACGFHSWSELMGHIRSREDRERERLRSNASLDGGDVTHFVLDLTNPLDVPRQVQEIYESIQRMADEEAAAEKADKGSSSP